MRNILYLMSILLWSGVLAQDYKNIELTKVYCEGKPLRLFSFDGFSMQPLDGAKLSPSTSSIKVPAKGHQLYYIGPDTVNVKPIILGGESNVKLSVNCTNSFMVSVENSPINDDYARLQTTIFSIRRKQNSALRNYQLYNKNPVVKEKSIVSLRLLDQEQIKYLDSIKVSNPFLSRIAAMMTYLSYPSYGKDKYDNENEYVSREFFRFVDWQDPGFDQLPWVYQGFVNYTKILINLYQDKEKFIAVVDTTLAEIPEGRKSKKLALGGIINVLRGSNHPGLEYYANEFIKHYGDENSDIAESLRLNVKKLKSLIVGGIAPDFTELSADGKEISLGDFRGKIVVLSFWASWAGKSLKQLPELKKIYAAYRHKGLEIIGVSLDRDKERWLKKIKSEELEWTNVSDFKGWQSEIALLYNINSIPSFIILDKNGKIISSNFDGSGLEEKLAEIFEE